MKKMILVTSPPACGKTFISKQLANHLRHVVYLDKDTLITLSNQIFTVAGQERNRSSQFFEDHIRDFEYETIIHLGMEALEYDDIVLINAPFTREIRSKAYIDKFRARLAAQGAKLIIIWVVTDPEICHQRMIARNSSRDTWKLSHWEEYKKSVNFDIPSTLDQPDVKDDLLLFYNSSEKEFQTSMEKVIHILEDGH